MTSRNLGPGATSRKTKKNRPQKREVVRRRRWKKRNGNTSVAWQADMGIVNGVRRLRSFDAKTDAENWLAEQRLLEALAEPLASPACGGRHEGFCK